MERGTEEESEKALYFSMLDNVFFPLLFEKISPKF